MGRCHADRDYSRRGAALGDGLVRINDQTLAALGRHLDGELECLNALCELLEQESIALRAMDLDALDKIAPLKSQPSTAK